VPRDDDERPREKKSWREIDKMRDGKRSGARTSADRDRERFEKTTKYSQYKSQLERMFRGGDLPQPMRDRLDPTGEGRKRDEAIRKMREAESPAQFDEAVNAFLAEFRELPDDPYLLDRALGHRDAKIVDRALEQLLRLHGEGALKPPPSLRPRLQSLQLTHDDPDVQDKAKALAAKIR
jgi:hypothetical protein